MRPYSPLEVIATGALVWVLVFALWESADGDEWKRADRGTLIRVSPDPRCVLDCPETTTTTVSTVTTGPELQALQQCVRDREYYLRELQQAAPGWPTTTTRSTTTTLPCPQCPECPECEEFPCPPCTVIPPPECLAREWEEKYLGAKNERDGFAILHQSCQQAHSNVKKQLKRCRGRK